jgi:hypothetical protein
MVTPEQLTWRDTPPVAPGAEIAVIEGPLNEPVPFTIRLRISANSRIAPHVHPAYERVTVLSGTFHLAHMATGSIARKRPLFRRGASPSCRPARRCSGTPLSNCTGTGPWGISYLDPAADPRRQSRAGTDRRYLGVALTS